MAENILLLASFLLFMFFFAGVGLASMRVKKTLPMTILLPVEGCILL